MLPRDMVKLASQFQESDEIPFVFRVSPDQGEALNRSVGP